MDYVTGQHIATIPAGHSSGVITIEIEDDDVIEVSETFNLTIDQSLLPNGVVLGSQPTLAIVTILDDDSE